MHMLTAFSQMLNGLCGGDAPDWQIDQVIAWEDKVRWTAVCAGRTGTARDGMQVASGESSSLPNWRTSCWRILRALEDQVRAADRLRIEEIRAAAELTVKAKNWAALGRAGAHEAALCLEEAEGHRKLAVRYAHWQGAARDAGTYGSSMLAGSLPRHESAARGLAAAGGTGEVYADKRWADDRGSAA